MTSLDGITSWLTLPDNAGIIIGSAVLIGAIIIAIVVGVAIGSSGRKTRKDAVETELNALAPTVMNVAIDASMYSSLEAEQRQRADREAIAVDMRIRLLNRNGAAEAADWLSAKFAALRTASSLERNDAARLLDQVRETFLTWAYTPRAAVRAFRRDSYDTGRG